MFRGQAVRFMRWAWSAKCWTPLNEAHATLNKTQAPKTKHTHPIVLIVWGLGFKAQGVGAREDVKDSIN